jgi:hypothetical protein
VITKILHKPVSIAQHVVGGVARGGLHGAVAVVKKVLPDNNQESHANTDTKTDTKADTGSASRVSTEPVQQPPSPTTTTKKATTNTMPAKKARADRAAAKKSAPATRSTGKKPAAVLDEDPAPTDADPVVYSSGPDVTTTLPKDELGDLLP